MRRQPATRSCPLPTRSCRTAPPPQVPQARRCSGRFPLARRQIPSSGNDRPALPAEFAFSSDRHRRSCPNHRSAPRTAYASSGSSSPTASMSALCLLRSSSWPTMPRRSFGNGFLDGGSDFRQSVAHRPDIRQPAAHHVQRRACARIRRSPRRRSRVADTAPRPTMCSNVCWANHADAECMARSWARHA